MHHSYNVTTHLCRQLIEVLIVHEVLTIMGFEIVHKITADATDAL